MQETLRLFDDDPYGRTFDARVITCQPGKARGTMDVVLARTLFFPEEGGQTPDTGLLGGFPVVDVQISPANVITHTVKTTAPFTPGETVHGEIDWAHRFSNMQNHTGEHILSGLLHRIYGFENVGFRLSDHTVTLDTSGHLSEDQLRGLETKANEVVWHNVPVTCGYPSAEELAVLDYRSKKEIEGAVRIVTIEGVDVCACCAPHVRRTGEIGLIKILSAIKSRGGSTRITLVCGQRALALMQSRQAQLEESSRLMNEPQDTIASGVMRLQAEITALKETCRRREQRIVDLRLSQLSAQGGASVPSASSSADPSTVLPSAPSAPGSAPIHGICLFETGLSVLSQRELMNRLCEMGFRYAGVFVCADTSRGADEEGHRGESGAGKGSPFAADGAAPCVWNYLIGGRGADARIPNATLKDTFGARGGGRPEMVQGTVTAREADIKAAMAPFL